jgi:polyribonucleotide nucleotidyltransferase
MNRKKFSIDVSGTPLTIEVSRLAEQADAAVLAQYGETVVLATVVMGDIDEPLDYLPLKVEYEERFYAAGQILGSRYMRREGKSSEEAVLTGRLIDRTLRPLFDHAIRRQIQVVVTVLAIDQENDPDFVSLIAASTALSLSSIPFSGPVAAVRVASCGSDFVINPTVSYLREHPATFEAFVAGPKTKINMLELGGYEAQEKDIISAFSLAQHHIDTLIDFQLGIVEQLGKPKQSITRYTVDSELESAVRLFLQDTAESALYQPDKLQQKSQLSSLTASLLSHLGHINAERVAGHLPVFSEKDALFVLDMVFDELVHKNILDENRRPDGRGLDEVRPLYGEVGLFERTHGSGLFMRGNTQALAVTTIAPPGQQQMVETMEVIGKRRFLLHYNFPPFSVGEVGHFRGPGRREIGHGALAKKAVEPLLPPLSEFPYTIRVVSEILSSNGSSSMATVSAAVFSLMDAGVPIKKPAAGIAMGIISGADGRYKILTDIQGPEDHYGDMDFKVAGTDSGVNAVQLDVKVDGLSIEMIEQTLEKARAARQHILQFMHTVIDAPRAQLSRYAPSLLTLRINPEKIGMVIGPGGKMINGLIAKYGLTSIDIEEDGTVFISSQNQEAARAAFLEISNMTKEFTVGEIVEGTIIKLLDFGAIVDLGGGLDGMIHVSELRNEYTKQVSDVVKVGDFVRAKVIKTEDGKIGLSIKQLPN